MSYPGVSNGCYYVIIISRMEIINSAENNVKFTKQLNCQRLILKTFIIYSLISHLILTSNVRLIDACYVIPAYLPAGRQVWNQLKRDSRQAGIEFSISLIIHNNEKVDLLLDMNRQLRKVTCH